MEEAVYSDCRCLIANFVQAGLPSFNSFCTQWKAMYFQHIFTAQTTCVELQQTALSAFHIGKRMMCNRKISTDSSYDFDSLESQTETGRVLQRIGGLYLMYAIYFKQPLEKFTKIEVSFDTWLKMFEVVHIMLSVDNPEYDEARYAFWKLYQSQAFRFTTLDFCVGLENLVDYDDLDICTTTSTIKGFDGIGRLIEKLTNFAEIKQTAPALVKLEKGYNAMKHSLKEKHEMNKELLPPINIFESISKSFSKIEKILAETNIPEISGTKNDKSSRRNIKDKAFRGNKNNQDQNVEAPSSSKTPRRMSSRTIFSGNLPKDIHEDLDRNTESEEDSSDEDSNDSTESEASNLSAEEKS